MISVHSIRAQKSRIAKRVGSTLSQALLFLLVVIPSLLGLALVATSQSIGYLLFAPSIWALMYLVWFKQYLDKLPVEPRNDLTGLLERRVLAELKSAEPTPAEVWQAIKSHNHSRFFALRYGLHPDMLGQMFGTNQTD